MDLIEEEEDSINLLSETMERESAKEYLETNNAQSLNKKKKLNEIMNQSFQSSIDIKEVTLVYDELLNPSTVAIVPVLDNIIRQQDATKTKTWNRTGNVLYYENIEFTVQINMNYQEDITENASKTQQVKVALIWYRPPSMTNKYKEFFASVEKNGELFYGRPNFGVNPTYRRSLIVIRNQFIVMNTPNLTYTNCITPNQAIYYKSRVYFRVAERRRENEEKKAMRGGFVDEDFQFELDDEELIEKQNKTSEIRDSKYKKSTYYSDIKMGVPLKSVYDTKEQKITSGVLSFIIITGKELNVQTKVRIVATMRFIEETMNI